jgi:NarL family two-component system response regulator LiaR
MLKWILQQKQILTYGAILALLLFVLRGLEYRFLILDHATDIYIGIISLLFTALGIWLAMKLMRPKQVVIEKQIYLPTEDFVLNEKALNESGISRRELEVLELMSKGLSNQEIGAELFVSLNTIKTHSANLFEKLDVKRRTQAVEKAKRLGLIP